MKYIFSKFNNDIHINKHVIYKTFSIYAIHFITHAHMYICVIKLLHTCIHQGCWKQGGWGSLSFPTFNIVTNIKILKNLCTALLYSFLYYTHYYLRKHTYHDSPNHDPIKNINPKSCNLHIMHVV